MKNIKRTIIALALSALLFSNMSHAQEILYKAIKNKSILLAEGLRLTHDLYLPENQNTKHSTILIRTPYSKAGSALFARAFAQNGYAVIVQDVRGKNDSEGVFIPFIHEKNDGLETLDWISKQPWSNGKVASWGSSYLGYCALVLADNNHPALKSVLNLSGWVDGQMVNNPGGALHQMLIIPWLLSDGQTSIASEKGLDLEEMFAYRPLRDAIPGSAGIFSNNRLNLTGNEKNSAGFNYENVQIPVLHINGWFDFTAQAAIDVYQLLKEKSANQQRLILGPWYHNQIYGDDNEVGSYLLPQTGILSIEDFLKMSVDWFDTTIGKQTEYYSEKSVKYYVLFEDAWHYSKQWPPEHQIKTLFLNDKSELSKRKNTATNSSSNYQFNPQNPTKTLGGANFYLFSDTTGIINQKSVEQRNDVLLFTSKDFLNSTIIAGNIDVELYVKTTGASTDFTAKLTLVNNQGESFNITDGIIRLPKEQINDGVTRVQIELGNTAFQVEKGEKIRLQISSSNYPKFNLNPNTGEDPLDALVFKTVKQTVLHSKKYPSKIKLPILKNENIKETK